MARNNERVWQYQQLAQLPQESGQIVVPDLSWIPNHEVARRLYARRGQITGEQFVLVPDYIAEPGSNQIPWLPNYEVGRPFKPRAASQEGFSDLLPFVGPPVLDVSWIPVFPTFRLPRRGWGQEGRQNPASTGMSAGIPIRLNPTNVIDSLRGQLITIRPGIEIDA